MKKIELKWIKIGNYKKFSETNTDQEIRSQKAGIYLWLEKIKKNDPDEAAPYYINYVGKSEKCLVSRNVEHFFNTFGGLYSIPAKYCEGRFREYPKTRHKGWVPDRSIKGMEFYNPDSQQIDFCSVSKSAHEYLKNIDIFFHYCESPEETKIIERNLIFQLQSLDNIRGAKSRPKNIHREFTHLCPGFPDFNLFECFEANLKALKDKTFKRTRNSWGTDAGIEEYTQTHEAAKELWAT